MHSLILCKRNPLSCFPYYYFFFKSRHCWHHSAWNVHWSVRTPGLSFSTFLKLLWLLTAKSLCPDFVSWFRVTNFVPFQVILTPWRSHRPATSAVSMDQWSIRCIHRSMNIYCLNVVIRKEAHSITPPRKAHYLAGCMNSTLSVDLASMRHLTFYWVVLMWWF